MLLFIKVFLVFISLYHILNTIVVYGLFDGQFVFLIAIIKDLVRILFVLILIFQHRGRLWIFIKKFNKPIILFGLLIIRGALLSIREGKTVYDMAVGYKYDIFFMFILLSSIFLGYVFDKKKLSDLLKFEFKILIFIIFFSIFRQIEKFLLPEIFLKIGYGPVGDYALGKNPPIYYRTGPGGDPRLSGIFSGPNNYGYILVLLFSIFFYSLKSLKSKINKSVLGILYMISCILTFSRGVLIGIIIQILLWLKQGSKKFSRSIIIIVITIIAGLFGYLSIWKFGSTIAHFKKSWGGLQKVLDNPIGYGLGTAGPSIHHQGSILPENTYLQILLDLGVIGFLLWLTFFYILIKNIYEFNKLNKKSKNHKEYTIYLKLLTLGFVGIMLEGFFLHVFEDSMVNYLFFINWGILIGILSNK